MLSLLAQIVTTFLAILATFLAAYGIYLISNQANIDAEIQKEGTEIVNKLQKAPIKKIPLLYHDIDLYSSYKIQNPDLGGIDLLQKIARDLLFEKDKIVEIATEGNVSGKATGRVAFWLLQRSLDSLAPNKVYWPGRGGLITSSSRSSEQESLFPFGPIGVKNWLQDFPKVNYVLKFLLLNKDIFLSDYKQFLAELDSPWKEQDYLHKFDYASWLNEMEDTVDSIENNYNNVSSLIRLKDNYSIKNRLSHLKWILALSVASFLLGVFLPLLTIGLEIESEVPSIVNILFLLVNVIVIFGIIIQLGLDISVSSHNKYAIYRYYISLRDQLLADQKKGLEELTFDHELVRSFQ
ncbi:MAG TPA: hypothetical protein VHT73_06190 [Thermodesulfobacteriota bacterium]|nr:hypothetical protein [Thermodesulfobacteriota bacterium]